jgi:glutamate racemase
MPITSEAYPKILIFDSGVGGLSIYQEIRRLLPTARYIYASDNEAFPYGTKPEEMVVSRVSRVLSRLTARFHPDVMVIACNTASTVALPKIRSQITIPVVGVVPAVKPAAQFSQSQVIGLLATPGTVKRAYTQNLIDEFAADCTVIRIGSSELVQMAENKLRGRSVDVEKIRHIISPFFEGEDGAKLDTIVLGCTHFPLLKTELESVAPRRVTWMDSGRAIARRVKSLLRSMPSGSASGWQLEGREPQSVAAFTAQDSDVSSLQPALQEMGIKQTVFL